MNASSLIDQLLKTGLAAVQGARERGDLDKYAKGAAAGGVLALLLRGRECDHARARGRGLSGQPAGGGRDKRPGAACLDALARELRLDDGLKAQLEASARATA